ncbi:MAG: hypothetical protein ACK56F_02435, partial [bacterium]
LMHPVFYGFTSDHPQLVTRHFHCGRSVESLLIYMFSLAPLGSAGYPTSRLPNQLATPTWPSALLNVI